MKSLREEAQRWLARPLLKDTLRLQVGQVLLASIHAARALLALRWLGPAAFGTYALAQSIVTSASLADFTAADRVALVGVSRALGGGSNRNVAVTLATFLRLSVAAGTLLGTAIWLLAPLIARRAYSQAVVGEYGRWLGVCLLLDVPFTFLTVVLQAQRRIRDLVSAEALRATAWLAATVAALEVSRSAGALVAAQVLVSALASGVAIAFYQRIARADSRFPTWTALLQQGIRRDLGPALATGSRIAIDKNLGSFAAQLPTLLLGLFDASAVGHLAAATRVMALPGPLLTGLARNLDAVLPARAAADPRMLRETFVRSTRLAIAGWMPVTAVTALCAPFVLLRFLGPAYAPAVVLVPALALQSIALGAGVGLGSAFRALDRVGWSIATQLATLILVTPIGYLLVQAQGATGAAWYFALRTSIATAAGIAIVLRLSLPSAPGPEKRTGNNGGFPCGS